VNRRAAVTGVFAFFAAAATAGPVRNKPR